MGQGSSCEAVAGKLRSLGEGGAYECVAAACSRFDLSGAFLLDASEEELEDFLVSRCPKLEALQRRRVLFELDCMKRREAAIRISDESSSESNFSADVETADDDSSGGVSPTWSGPEKQQREAWRTEGPLVGADVERELWDDLGVAKTARRGVVVAYCAAEDSTFLNADGVPVALWRARFESLEDCVELDEDEVRDAVSQYEQSILDQARKVYEPHRGRQRVGNRGRDDSFPKRSLSGLSPCPEGDEDEDDVEKTASTTTTKRRRGDAIVLLSDDDVKPLVPPPPQKQRVAVVGGHNAAKLLRNRRSTDDSVRRQQLALQNTTSIAKLASGAGPAGMVTRRSSSSSSTLAASASSTEPPVAPPKPAPKKPTTKVVVPELKKKRGRPRKTPIEEPVVVVAVVEPKVPPLKIVVKSAPKKRKVPGSPTSRRPASSSKQIFVEASVGNLGRWDPLPDPQLPPAPAPTRTLGDLAWNRPDAEMTVTFVERPVTPPPIVPEVPPKVVASEPVDIAVVTPSHAPRPVAVRPQKKPRTRRCLVVPSDQRVQTRGSSSSVPVDGDVLSHVENAPPGEEASSKATPKPPPLELPPPSPPPPQQRQPPPVQQQPPSPPQRSSTRSVQPPPSPQRSTRPKRSLAGRRACPGCHSSPCLRTKSECFRGVESSNGRYVARGDRHRFENPEDAARRYDMMLRSGERSPVPGERELPNFADDDTRIAWETAFFERLCEERVDDHLSDETGDEDRAMTTSIDNIEAAALEAPGGRVDCGVVLEDSAGRSWYVAKDEETITDICRHWGLDPSLALAANLRASHFHIGPKLTLKSKLKHHTRVLLTF